MVHACLNFCETSAVGCQIWPTLGSCLLLAHQRNNTSFCTCWVITLPWTGTAPLRLISIHIVYKKIADILTSSCPWQRSHRHPRKRQLTALISLEKTQTVSWNHSLQVLLRHASSSFLSDGPSRFQITGAPDDLRCRYCYGCHILFSGHNFCHKHECCCWYCICKQTWNKSQMEL